MIEGDSGRVDGSERFYLEERASKILGTYTLNLNIKNTSLHEEKPKRRDKQNISKD